MAPHAEYKAASDVVGDNNGNWIDLRYESGAGLGTWAGFTQEECDAAKDWIIAGLKVVKITRFLHLI